MLTCSFRTSTRCQPTNDVLRRERTERQFQRNRSSMRPVRVSDFTVSGDIMRYRTFVLAAAAVIMFSASATAQQPALKLEIGKWSGIVTPPDGNAVNVIYDVAYAGDTLRITINADSHGTFPVTEAKLEG